MMLKAISKRKRTTRVILLLLLVTLCLGVPFAQVGAYTASLVLLPEGEPLTSTELAEIEGQAWVGAAMLGAASFAAHELANNYVNGRTLSENLARRALIGAMCGAVAGGTILANGVIRVGTVVRGVAAGALSGYFSP